MDILQCDFQGGKFVVSVVLRPRDLPRFDQIAACLKALLEVGDDAEERHQGYRNRLMVEGDLRCADLHPIGSKSPAASVEDVPNATRQEVERGRERAPQLS